MELAIVKVYGKDGTTYYHGVFENGDAACSWAYKNCQGFDWNWEPISVIVQEDTNRIVPLKAAW